MANLVAKFDKHFSGSIINTTLLKNVSRLETLINGGQTYENLKTTIQYMIDKNINIFNFIDSNINKALSNKKTTVGKNNNPCFDESLDREYEIVLSEIIAGRIKSKDNSYLKYKDKLNNDKRFLDFLNKVRNNRK